MNISNIINDSFSIYLDHPQKPSSPRDVVGMLGCWPCEGPLLEDGFFSSHRHRNVSFFFYLYDTAYLETCMCVYIYICIIYIYYILYNI